MRLSLFIAFALLTVGVLFAFGVMVDDLEKNYVDTGIVDVSHMNSTYKNTFNESQYNISSEFEDIEEGFRDLSTQDSWWEGLGDFIGAIPLVIINFPRAALAVTFSTIGNISIALTSLGIPIEIIILITLGITIWLIIKLINFWQAKEPV